MQAHNYCVPGYPASGLPPLCGGTAVIRSDGIADLTMRPASRVSWGIHSWASDLACPSLGIGRVCVSTRPGMLLTADLSSEHFQALPVTSRYLRVT